MARKAANGIVRLQRPPLEKQNVRGTLSLRLRKGGRKERGGCAEKADVSRRQAACRKQRERRPQGRGNKEKRAQR